MPRKLLFACGIATAIVWVATDIIATLRADGYSYLDFTISELWAEGAPTRGLMLALNGVVYSTLLAAFGFGVRDLPGRPRAARIAGTLLVINAIFSALAGWLIPMKPRAALAADEGTLRNALHAPGAMIGVVLSLVSLYYLSTLISRRFTWATLGTIAVILVTGTMMGVQSGRMVDNKSTPWMGLEERISAYGMVIWTALAAAMLLRTEVSTRYERRQTPRPTALPLSGVPG